MPAWRVRAAKIVATNKNSLTQVSLKFRSRSRAFHFDIHNSELPQLFQIFHFIGLCEFAEGSVESTLSFVEVIRAHSLSRQDIVRILSGIGQSFQLARQLPVENGRPMNDFSEHCLQLEREEEYLSLNTEMFKQKNRVRKEWQSVRSDYAVIFHAHELTACGDSFRNYKSCEKFSPQPRRLFVLICKSLCLPFRTCCVAAHLRLHLKRRQFRPRFQCRRMFQAEWIPDPYTLHDTWAW